MKFSKRLKSMQASPIRKLAPFAAQAKADGVISGLEIAKQVFERFEKVDSFAQGVAT